jgi:RNA polymerase sigma-70 factor, ECF subfamily
VSAVTAAPLEADVGSAEAYAGRLYERHSRAIYRLCVKHLRRKEDADDAVQTTFIYALLSLRRGVVPQMELPWLMTIARNVCSTRRRSGMRRGAYESPLDLDSFQDRLASPDRSDGVTPDEFRSVLRELPESQRTALLLREWRGLSYEEIGSELGLSQAATEALLFRARQNVAQRLGSGLKVLNGLPLVSFLRNLLQAGSAQLAVVAAGTALTIAAVPAAAPEPAQITVTPPSAASLPATRVGARPPRATIAPARDVTRHPRTASAVAKSAPPQRAGIAPATSTAGRDVGAKNDAPAPPTVPPASPPTTGPVPDSITSLLPTTPTVTVPSPLPQVQVPPVTVTVPTVTVPDLPGSSLLP